MDDARGSRPLCSKRSLLLPQVDSLRQRPRGGLAGQGGPEHPRRQAQSKGNYLQVAGGSAHRVRPLIKGCGTLFVRQETLPAGTPVSSGLAFQGGQVWSRATVGWELSIPLYGFRWGKPAKIHWGRSQDS